MKVLLTVILSHEKLWFWQISYILMKTCFIKKFPTSSTCAPIYLTLERIQITDIAFLVFFQIGTASLPLNPSYVTLSLQRRLITCWDMSVFRPWNLFLSELPRVALGTRLFASHMLAESLCHPCLRYIPWLAVMVFTVPWPLHGNNQTSHTTLLIFSHLPL